MRYSKSSSTAAPENRLPARPNWTKCGDGIITKLGPDGKPVYYARIIHNGRRYVSKGGSTKAKALLRRGTLLNEIERARNAGVDWVPPTEKKRKAKAQERKRLTFAEFSKVFLRDHASGKRRKRWYEDQVRVLVKVFGKQHLDAITAHDVARYKAAETRRKIAGDRKVSPHTINHRLQFLRLMFGRAQAWGYVTGDPTEKVELLVVPAPQERFFSPAETTDIVARIAPRSRPVVQLALLTGMRRGELLGLTWGRVNLEEKRAHLPITKNGRPRYVPLNADAAGLLAALPRHTTTDRVFCHRGQPLTERQLRDDWDDLGVDGRFHDLRHTWASRQVKAGTDLYLLMKLGGWSSYAMVQRYAHFAPEALQEAAERVTGTAGVSPQVSPSSAPCAPLLAHGA